VNLTGIVSTAVTINEGFAGAAGPGLVALARNGATAGEWDVPAGSLLTTDQVNALLQGKLYVKAASAANPNGEIRGQIAPANISVIFADLSGAQEVPAVGGAAAGVAATTVDAQANTVSVHVHATGVDDATAAEVDNGAAGSTGTKLVALTQDAVQPGHWSTELAAITAARGNDLQKSVNLALGSSLATIGLTIPAVAVAAYALDKQLVLGLNDQELVLLVLTFVLSMLTFVTGRTNILFGLVHVVVFAVFVFLVFVP